jgi:hypothetical protein
VVVKDQLEQQVRRDRKALRALEAVEQKLQVNPGGLEQLEFKGQQVQLELLASLEFMDHQVPQV